VSEAAVASTYGDAITAPFWEAAAREELVIQRCRACGSFQFYPRPLCLKCQSMDLTWQLASGRGRVYSLTTVRLQVDPALPVPYDVAIVELDEGPRLLTHLIDGAAAIGDAVEVRWRARSDAPPLPVFAPVRTA
jgi:uncharacterized OB-fold protein